MLATLFILFSIATVIAAAPQCFEHRTIDARRRERCPECGYPLGGLDEIGRCPECQHQYSLLPVYRRVLCICPERLHFVVVSLALAFGGSWVCGGLLTSVHGRAIAGSAGLTFARGCDLAAVDLPWFGGLVMGPALLGITFLLFMSLWKWPMRRVAACQRGALAAALVVTLGAIGHMFFRPRDLWSPADFEGLATLSIILVAGGAALGFAFDWWRRVNRSGWGVEA